MNILFLAIGTDGDVNPMIALGRLLRDRGHKVTLISNECYETLASRNGFMFAATGTADEWHRTLANPNFWHPIKSGRTVAAYGAPLIPAQYQAIADRYEAGRTVLVCQCGAFAAGIAHETLGVPIVTVVLQPGLIRSINKMPVVSGLPVLPDWSPRLVKRVVWRVIDGAGDLLVAKSVNGLRADLGLAPVKRLLRECWFSPQRVLGLFPDWYGPPQPDWPPQLRLTGFLTFDNAVERSLPADVERFLAEGDAPIVFTLGTGMMHGKRFFRVALETCRQLGRRGLLLTRYRSQIPIPLPAEIRHYEYVPFAQLLPRAAAVVHHGGVGTVAQAMAAGIPQLVMPLAYDQPDNAARVQRLGVGDWLRPRQFQAQTVAGRLRFLLGSREVAANCRSVARRVADSDHQDEMCQFIEELADTKARRL